MTALAPAPSELELIGRVAIAAACGALVGLERELSEKPAGLRTHALVAMGSAAFTVSGYSSLVIDHAMGGSGDVSRVAAQIVNGIGFLGGGIVIFHGDRLRGLTTAAEVWAVAAIGLLAGFGQIDVALAMTVLMVAVVVAGRPIETVLDKIRRRNLLQNRIRRRERGESPSESEAEAEAELDDREDAEVDVAD